MLGSVGIRLGCSQSSENSSKDVGTGYERAERPAGKSWDMTHCPTGFRFQKGLGKPGRPSWHIRSWQHEQLT